MGGDFIQTPANAHPGQTITGQAILGADNSRGRHGPTLGRLDRGCLHSVVLNVSNAKERGLRGWLKKIEAGGVYMGLYLWV